jgi:uncharacterized protein (DUF302 family)
VTPLSEQARGLTTVPSGHPVKTTIDRLSEAAEQAGLLVFARIDHSTNAAEFGLHLRPTELVLCGHPRGGTPLMQDRQTAGIDLPVRAVAWEDESGQVWLTYNDADWIAERHRLGPESSDGVAAIRAGLAGLTAIATSGGDRS